MNYFLLESLFVIFEPVLALKLTHDYSYSSLQISWAFTILLVTSLVGASICVLLPEDLDKRKLILVTNLTLVVGVFCTGPSSLMHLPNSDIILLVGLGSLDSQQEYQIRCRWLRRLLEVWLPFPQRV